MLCLNKMLFRFRNVKSQQWFTFTTSRSQTQVFFSNYFVIPNISSQSAILGFMEEIQDQRNIFINYILLIYKHMCLSRNYESLNSLILKIIFQKQNFYKKKQLKAIHIKSATFFKKMAGYLQCTIFYRQLGSGLSPQSCLHF